jgi:hypothetical protein
VSATETLECPPLGLGGPAPADNPFTSDIRNGLLAPFPLDEIDFLPKTLTKDGSKAMAIPYIDARAAMNRLDEVVGPGNWSFDWDPVCDDPTKVKGKLTVLGVTKCDVGEAKQEEEKVKAAVSDALKRCAVHFGIGRFLYYLPTLFAPCKTYDRNGEKKFSSWDGIPDVMKKDIENACRIIGFTGKIDLKPRQTQQESNGSAIRVQAIPLTEQQRDGLTIKSGATIPAAKPVSAPTANGATETLCEICKLQLPAPAAAMSRRKFGNRVLCPVHQQEQPAS